MPAVSGPHYRFVTDPNTYLIGKHSDGITGSVVKFEKVKIRLPFDVQESQEEAQGAIQHLLAACL